MPGFFRSRATPEAADMSRICPGYVPRGWLLVSNGWLPEARSISGHVFRKERVSGPVWYAKYRLPDGRQVRKKIAPAWMRPGRPADGFVNRRGAEAWLTDVLAQAHAGTLPGMV